MRPTARRYYTTPPYLAVTKSTEQRLFQVVVSESENARNLEICLLTFHALRCNNPPVAIFGAPRLDSASSSSDATRAEMAAACLAA